MIIKKILISCAFCVVNIPMYAVEPRTVQAVVGGISGGLGALSMAALRSRRMATRVAGATSLLLIFGVGVNAAVFLPLLRER